ERDAAFTAVSNADILKFDAKNDAYFLAFYPSTPIADISYGNNTFTFEIANNAEQTQDDVYGTGIDKYIPKYDFVKANATNTWDAVGEKVNLYFERLATAAVFKTKGLNKKNQTLFGKLKTITLTVENAKIGGGSTAPSLLTFGGELGYEANVAITLDENTVGSSAVITDGTSTLPASSIKLNLGTSGLEWSDEARAYAAIRRVDRTTNKLTEDIKVKYEFENIDFTETVAEQYGNDWPTDLQTTAIGFVGIPALDISSYPYLVTGGASSTTRSLIINGGEGFKFSDIFDETTGKVIWPRYSDNKIDLTDFTTIISDIEVDMDKIGGFLNVVNLELNVNTDVPTKSLENLTALKSIDMPEVVTIAEDAFPTLALDSAKLKSYKFLDGDVNSKILNKTSLMVLDMSSVDAIGARFPASGFSLDGFSLLKKVTVKDGLILGASAFRNCIGLTTIVGGPVVLEGAGAFEGCTSLTEAKIYYAEDTPETIPADSFKDCTSLLKVIDGSSVEQKSVIMPTTIESKAFQNCKKLTQINLMFATTIGEFAFNNCELLGNNPQQDLSKVEALGESAFEGCTTLVGCTPYYDGTNNRKVLWISATSIPKNAFKNCKSLVYVYFEKATEISGGILTWTSTGAVGDPSGRDLKEIKFGEVFTSVGAGAFAFGDARSAKEVKLFVKTAQSGVDQNSIALGNGTATMLSIIKENSQPRQQP
ncbi:leucine-rich repeat domain-containing protein, partial [Bacteroides sp. OttesenSCG-928-N06]|nr:leucine-rich repeat domain-containing protein [Bacteroides sp. OttesenSCG-928-N06]